MKANSVEITCSDFYGGICPPIVGAFYAVPFIVAFSLLLLIFIFMLIYVCYGDKPFQDKICVLEKNDTLKGNVIAAILICVILTLYIFALDVA